MNDYCLDRAKVEDWLVCTYGLGYLGKRLRHSIPNIFNLKPHYYCDSDNSKVDEMPFADSQPIYKEELKNMSVPVIVFILTDDPYDIEIENDLKFNANLYTYTLRKLALMDRVIHDFYGDELFSIYKRL